MAPPIFGRAAITFGIGPHSSLLKLLFILFTTVAWTKKQQKKKQANKEKLDVTKLEIWANAQRDGRPADKRWRKCCQLSSTDDRRQFIMTLSVHSLC